MHCASKSVAPRTWLLPEGMFPMQLSQVTDAFLMASVNQMEVAERSIDRCLDKLSDEQICHRRADYENSIANLLLHLEGNLRQWFLHGIDGQPDVRTRDSEFALSLSMPPGEIRKRFAATLADGRSIIRSLPPERLLVTINPQPTGNWGPMTILAAIYRIISHLEMHTGQIVLLTKQLQGCDLDLSIPRKR
jgi:uncharacterized damage-inducible protein DinB